MAAAPTRDTILDAAERVFARQGYTGTTIKQIGAEAGVNSALLYYYFRDKEELYRAMLRRAIGAIAETGARAIGDAHDPEDAIRHFVIAQGELLAARPLLPRLILRELIDHEAAHADAAITDRVSRTFARLCACIERGQRASRFRRDLDPRFAAISTLAQVVYFHAARPAVGILLGHGRRGAPPDVAREFAEHAAEFALHALRSPPAPRAARDGERRRHGGGTRRTKAGVRGRRERT